MDRRYTMQLTATLSPATASTIVRSRGRDWSDLLVIQKGLTVQILGHMIDLVRDERNKVATVQVKFTEGYQDTPDGTKLPEVQKAADMLAKRAERFLGMEWRVIRWQP